MRRGRELLVPLGAVALLLAVWVVSTRPVRVWHAAHLAGRHLPAQFTGQCVVNHKRQPAAVCGAAGRHGLHLPGWFASFTAWVAYLGGGLILLALILLLVYARPRRKRGDQRLLFGDGDPAAEGEVTAAPDEIVKAADRQLAAIFEGSPRNAIVACWMALERAVVECGFERDRAETSTEFTARVLATYGVDGAAIDSLAALYREARFSEHELTDRHRDQAVVALRQLSADLGRPAALALDGAP